MKCKCNSGIGSGNGDIAIALPLGGITLMQIYSQLAEDKNEHINTSVATAGSKLLKLKKTNKWLSANDLIRMMQNKGLT